MTRTMIIRPGHWAVAALLLAGACTRDGSDFVEDPSGIEGLEATELAEVTALKHDDDDDRNDRGGKHDDDKDDRRSDKDRQRFKRRVTPIFECVEEGRNGKLIAHFGYKNAGNQPVTIELGHLNWFHPKPANRGQPTRFRVGTQTNVFTVQFNHGTLVWSLDGRIAVAHKKSKRCVRPTPDAGSDVPVPPQCPASCDDGNSCTSDRCDTATGQCVNTPAAAGQSCSDGNQCNGAETCNAQGVCAPGTAPNCDDQNPCTTDSCSATGGCGHAAGNEGGACPLAGGTGVCRAGTCTPVTVNCDDSNPCTVDAPDGSGGCSHTAGNEGGSCADTNVCNGAETCRAGVCAPGTTLSCDDGNACTDDSCNATTGCVRTNRPNGTVCAPATQCGGASTCQSGVCTAGPNGSCDDQNPCTADSCGPGGTCLHAPLDGNSCADTNACNGAEICRAGTCAAGTAVVCTASDQCHEAGVCNPATGACTNPASPETRTCSDGNACTEGDLCRSGTCTGTARTCTASDQCHAPGVCNPATGACTNPVAVGQSCNDGNMCTSGDVCAADGTCAGSGTCGPTPCERCMADNCPGDIAGCSQLTGDEKARCEALVSCMTTNRCVVNGDAQPCYCGTVSDAACLGGDANGVCKAQVEAARGSTDPNVIGSDFVDPAYPLGRATLLFACQAALCSDVCQ
jgi:hypothetical protein